MASLRLDLCPVTVVYGMLSIWQCAADTQNLYHRWNSVDCHNVLDLLKKQP